MNPMNEVQISKATVSIGVGEAGEKLSRAITLLEQMFDQTPVKTFSKVTNPEFGIRKRQPIACKLTLRGEKADKAIEMVLEGINKNIKPTQFDDQGNLSFAAVFDGHGIHRVNINVYYLFCLQRFLARLGNAFYIA